MDFGIKRKLNESNRLYYWDNIKGILIITVVFGHFLWDYWGLGSADIFIKIIYFFHMPSFAYVSGYLSKSENSRSKHNLSRMILIYIIFNFSILILHNILFSPSFSLITPLYSYWFLLSLIIWRMTVSQLAKIKASAIFLLFAALLIGFWGDATNVLAISRTVVFYPFFMMGFLLDSNYIDKLTSSENYSQIIKGSLLLAAGVILAFVLSQTNLLTQSNLVMDPYRSVSDIAVRVMVFQVSLFVIGGLLLLVRNHELPLLTRCGKNSLAIYVLHRPVTLMFFLFFPKESYTEYFVLLASSATIVTVYLLSLGSISRVINKSIDEILYHLHSATERLSKKSLVLALTVILFLSLPIFTPLFDNNKSILNPVPVTDYPIHDVIPIAKLNQIDEAATISFVGDLILLQQQVERAWDDESETYNFDTVFEYAKKYLEDADLAIGIFEGPVAGAEVGYSTSNYDDGIPLSLNFPDSFAEAVKDSGIDLVSLANNHLLDKGIQGANRTRNLMKEIKLLHTGSYETKEDKEEPQIIEVEGIKIGILSYTFKSNGYTDDYFINENPNITSIIVSPDSPYFQKVKENVKNDFRKLKEMDAPPELIFVIPHMGTQFIHETDEFQKSWNQIFLEYGADIILGDHSHAVQPIEYRTRTLPDGSSKQSLIINSPGNFVNSYIEHNGDATAIVEIHIDKKTKEILASSIIPMYTQAPVNGNYRALPIYDIMTNEELQSDISEYEMSRIGDVHKITTSVMLGVELPIDQIQEKYYFLEEGYARNLAPPLSLDKLPQDSAIINSIQKASTISFIGDSITKGSRNGGYGWYEPIISNFPEKKIINHSWDSATTKTLLEHADIIVNSPSDLYIIAIGTNDVRYRDPEICAMDPTSYITNLDTLIHQIFEKNQNAEFILVRPWPALANDPFTPLPASERDKLFSDYGSALEIYSKQKNFLYADPSRKIAPVFSIQSESKFLLDHIHPNSTKGIKLYSDSFLFSVQH